LRNAHSLAIHSHARRIKNTKYKASPHCDLLRGWESGDERARAQPRRAPDVHHLPYPRPSVSGELRDGGGLRRVVAGPQVGVAVFVQRLSVGEGRQYFSLTFILQSIHIQ
jgi:hypothetical protein